MDKLELLTQLANQLKQSATNVLGFADLIGDDRVGRLNPKQREYLQDVKASAFNILSALDDIDEIGTIGKTLH
jgi:signal transduction histidine kinase